MNRQQLQTRLFPSGIPKLWCPPLTFFSQPQCPDAARIEQHLQRLSRHVRGLLVPGSTGEGWEMSDEQIARLLEIVLPVSQRLGLHVSIGILKTTTDQVLRGIDWLDQYLRHPACVGLTLCAARGAELTQEQLASGLRQVLRLGIPTALYQLPQVTQNSLDPLTVQSLIAEFANVILFKDTSGQDQVANAAIETDGVFMVRGAERGGYALWLKSSGGNYDGFLLSTANIFAPQLAEIIQASDTGDRLRAERISSQLVAIVGRAFEVVSDLTVGNPFTNANKCVEHLQRFGSAYASAELPLLYSGARLPLSCVEQLWNDKSLDWSGLEQLEHE